MSKTMRILFYGLMGITGGLAVWPFVEILVYVQGSLLLHSTLLGGVIGLFMGGAFGITEGILQQANRKIISGLVTGLVIGLFGGAIGILSGQFLLLFIGTNVTGEIGSFGDLGYPLAKALGWAIFGIFIGIVEGVRSRSPVKIRNGILGGILGGFLGGFVFEMIIRLGFLDAAAARLIGLVLLGFFIGLFYGLVENRLARASLLALNGPSKGKEFLVNERVMTIGAEDSAAMTIAGYTQVAPEHAIVRRKKNDIILQDNKSRSGTFVNDQKVNETIVKDGDVIRVGDAQFLFRKK
jgi:hypothetical protein